MDPDLLLRRARDAGAQLGTSFSHVLELPQKLSLGAHDYLTVQSIYQTFGPVAALLEPLTFASLFGLVLAARRRAHPGIALGVFVASVVVWFVVVRPMNAEFASWHGVPPGAWKAVRDRWECGHVAVFALKLVAYAVLAWFAVLDRAGSPSSRASRA